MSGIVSRKHLGRLGLSTLAVSIFLLTSEAASAQDAAPPGTPQQSDVQANGEATKKGDNEIIVTGSRVGRSTFDTPQPVTVLNQEDIQNLNLNNVGRSRRATAVELELLRREQRRVSATSTSARSWSTCAASTRSSAPAR